jgi:hypothetical protein
VKRWGFRKPLPHTSSNLAVGFESITCASVLPAFTCFLMFPDTAASMSRYAFRSALVASGPWPGMILVSSAAIFSTRSALAITPSRLPPLEVSMNG